jgi:molecular chaperone GrpE (heat shock protein)
VAPGAVAQVILKGYRRGERALRAARVVVAKSAAKD